VQNILTDDDRSYITTDGQGNADIVTDDQGAGMDDDEVASLLGMSADTFSSLSPLEQSLCSWFVDVPPVVFVTGAWGGPGTI
jgi:hypothetical protein